MSNSNDSPIDEQSEREEPSGRMRSSANSIYSELASLFTHRRFWLICCLLAAAALGFRLAGLNDRTLNVDEVVTRKLSAEWNWTAIGKRPPLSFLLVAGSLRIQNNQFMLLFPAALFGAATVGLLAWTGRVAFGWRAGLIAGLWLLFASRHIHYSQYARYYAFMIFFSLLSYFYLDLWVRMKRRRYLAFWFFASIFNLLSHFFAACVVGVQAGLVLVVLVWRVLKRGDRRTRVRNGLILGAASALFAFAAWVAYSKVGISWWVEQFLETSTGSTAGVDMSWGFWREYLDEMVNWPHGWMAVALVLIALGVAAAAHRNRLFLVHTVAVIVGPVVAVYIIRPNHPFLFRYVSYGIPFLVLTMSAGIALIWETVVRRLPDVPFVRRPVQVVLVALALIAPFQALRAHANRQTPREFRDAAEFLNRLWRPGERILFIDHDDWREFTHVAPQRIRGSCQNFDWKAVRTVLYPDRFFRPFWVVTGRFHRTAQVQPDMEWAMNTLSHKAFDWGYVYASCKHLEMDLSGNVLPVVKTRDHLNVSSILPKGYDKFELSVYVPRSWDYYVLTNTTVSGGQLCIYSQRPLKWIPLFPRFDAERAKVWLPEGRHDLVLSAPAGGLEAVKNLRLRFIPAFGSEYAINATEFDAVQGFRSLDRPVTYQGRFGIEMRMWGFLYYPMYVEHAGLYEFSVTADNDRPTTNRVMVVVDNKYVKEFMFNKLDNSIETKKGIVRLEDGFRMIGLRNAWYKGVDEVRRGPIPDLLKTTFISDIRIKPAP